MDPIEAKKLLWRGLEKAHLPWVAQAIQGGADVNQCYEIAAGYNFDALDTPLHGAFKPSRPAGSSRSTKTAMIDVGEIVLFLLQNGADPRALDANGRTPLMMHVDSHLLKISAAASTTLTQASVEVINAASKPQGLTALHAAMQLGDLNLVKRLVKHGADMEARTKPGITPLWAASYKIHDQQLYSAPDDTRLWHCVHFLVSKGADINARDLQGNTLPMVYFRLSLEELVALGLDLKAVNDAGQNILACQLDALENGKVNWMYVENNLNTLAAHGGMDWHSTKSSQGHTAFELVMASKTGEMNGILQSHLDQSTLDEHTHPTSTSIKGPRL